MALCSEEGLWKWVWQLAWGRCGILPTVYLPGLPKKHGLCWVVCRGPPVPPQWSQSRWVPCVAGSARQGKANINYRLVPPRACHTTFPSGWDNLNQHQQTTYQTPKTQLFCSQTQCFALKALLFSVSQTSNTQKMISPPTKRGFRLAKSTGPWLLSCDAAITHTITVSYVSGGANGKLVLNEWL